jgi:hypothetical protein
VLLESQTQGTISSTESDAAAAPKRSRTNNLLDEIRVLHARATARYAATLDQQIAAASPVPLDRHVACAQRFRDIVNEGAAREVCASCARLVCQPKSVELSELNVDIFSPSHPNAHFVLFQGKRLALHPRGVYEGMVGSTPQQFAYLCMECFSASNKSRRPRISLAAFDPGISPFEEKLEIFERHPRSPGKYYRAAASRPGVCWRRCRRSRWACGPSPATRS